ncbi:MAG TPA: LLM class F420-dependent oxidoreductase, partial [Alphaproteobacteria bacterium]|nr:LLM class F420-dependent oxidoreductase [Alphaproteobacteria bacterium]
PWGKPAARMRELILAMRAIWANWYEGQPLDFRGEFYTHTLMTPM